ncbi:MAG TPA: LytTR family DNA-binding domain-containing protein [Cyclobacteriaceae bacterium]|nr:LytTR family DNA-binding domain-containing protein [Cyclobacteriaceae bacterium]
MKLNCLIIDDEPLARKGISEYVKEVDFLQLAGECGSAAEAVNIIAAKPVDLLLLDIQMPRLNGIDFLKALTRPPMAIITTAFSEYALEGYSLDVIDYLVKPIPFDRFLKAVQKAFDFHQLKLREAHATAPEYFFVKSNGKFERVAFSDILYVESMQNYVLIHVPGQKLIVYMTLAGLESQLPPGRFMKVHKSYIVSLEQVNSIENNEIIIRQSRIPISRTLKEDVMKRILGDNLLSR